MKRTLLVFWGSILLSAPVAITAQEYSDFQYATNGNAITITGYTGTNAAVAIPNTIDAFPVTTIGAVAFVGLTNLSSVTIPDSLTLIGDRAFVGCANLAIVTMGNGVTRIGDYAFANCAGLTNVAIPNSATSIGNGAFLGCVSLPIIGIPDSVTNMGNNTFGACANLASVTIGVGIARIGDYAFENCVSLTNILLPDSLTSIGAYAFGGCAGLATITIPDSLMSISVNSFDSCTSLTSLTFPSGLTSIADNAFHMCTNLTSLFFVGNAPSLGSPSVFSGDSMATVYYLGQTIGWGQTFGDLPTVSVPPPSITVQPRSVTTNLGATVTFSVEASGHGPLSEAPLSYQWFFNGDPIASATMNSYVIGNVLPPGSGGYSVAVSNAAGSATSSSAELTVQFPHTAIATIGTSNGLVRNATITDGGFGYTNPPLVEIIGGGGSGAQAVAVLTDGVVTGIMVTDPGSGYSTTPTVALTPPFFPILSIIRTNTPAGYPNAVIPTAQNLILGQAYQFQVSIGLNTWMNSGSPFTATNSSVVCAPYFYVSDSSQLFFRLAPVQ